MRSMPTLRKDLWLVIALAAIPSSLVFLVGFSLVEFVFFFLTIGLISTIVLAAGIQEEFDFILAIPIDEGNLPVLFLLLLLATYGLVFLVPEGAFTIFFVALLTLT